MNAYKLLVTISGYIRNTESEIDIQIPKDVQNIIILHNIKYAIYGIGVNMKNKFAFSDFGWNQLSTLNDIDIQNIYKDFTIITSDHQILIPCGNITSPLTNVTKLTGVNGILAAHKSLSIYPWRLFVDNTNMLFKYYPHQNELLILPYKFSFKYEKIKEIKCSIDFVWILSDEHRLYQTSNILVKPKLQFMYKNVIDFDVGYHCVTLINKLFELIIIDEYDCPISIYTNKYKIMRYFKTNHIKINIVKSGLFFGLCVDKNGNCYVFGNYRNDSFYYNPKTIKNKNPLKILLGTGNNDHIIKADCGYFHSILLTEKNDVIVFGYNFESTQKSYVISTEIEKRWINVETPHILNREKELNIENDSYVDDILASDCHSLLFINPIKKRKILNM